jgi:hypothetical protein
MISLNVFIDFHASFNTPYGIGDYLIHYLACPRARNLSFNFEEAVRVFFNRETPRRLDEINAAPTDIHIFRKRFELIANNNEAYRIAVSKNPTSEELIAFSFMQPGWSVLFAVKQYLMDHMDKAMQYTGFLPYGKPVIAFVNSLESKPRAIPTMPTFADHLYLQQISNREALTFNMPSVEINNIMYLRGLKILKGKGLIVGKPAEITETEEPSL